MPEALNIATVAHDTNWGNVGANLGATERHVAEVLTRAASTDLILFPELSLTGYILDSSAVALAQPLDGPTVMALRTMAARHIVALAAGLIEAGPDRPYNTQVVVDSDGAFLAAGAPVYLVRGA